MAGDILLYQTDRVPIGDDQRQHLELARDIAERFNSRFGETFVVPRGDLPGDRRADHGSAGAAREDVHDRRRRRRGRCCILDAPDVIRKKLKSAVTDSGTRGAPRRRQARRHEPDRHPVASRPASRPRRSRRATTAGGYGQFKSDVAEAVVALLEPIQARYHELRDDPGELHPAARASAPTRRASLGADARDDVRAHGVHPALAVAVQLRAAAPRPRRLELAPGARREPVERERPVAAAVQAQHGVADGGEHALHLVLAALVDRQLDRAPAEPARARRARWGRRRARRPSREPLRASASVGSPSTSAT